MRGEPSGLSSPCEQPGVGSRPELQVGQAAAARRSISVQSDFDAIGEGVSGVTSVATSRSMLCPSGRPSKPSALIIVQPEPLAAQRRLECGSPRGGRRSHRGSRSSQSSSAASGICSGITGRTLRHPDPRMVSIPAPPFTGCARKRVTPAREAGIANHVWAVKKLWHSWIEGSYEQQTCRRGHQFGSLFRSSTGDGVAQSRVEFVCRRRGDRPWRLTWHGRVVEVRFWWTIRRGIGPQEGI